MPEGFDEPEAARERFRVVPLSFVKRRPMRRRLFFHRTV